MFSDLISECEGCENRKEIMGAGTWQVDALALGLALAVIVVIAYLQH